MGIQINGQTDTISAVDNNFSLAGNVSIGGTLTYEDVTSVDSVGIITAQSGINVSGGNFVVGGGATISSAGAITAAGKLTVGAGLAQGSKPIEVNTLDGLDRFVVSGGGTVTATGDLIAAGALLRSTSTSDGPSLQFDGAGPNGTNYIFGKIEGDNTGSNNAGELRFYTNLASAGGLTQRMVIARDGSVGIGTVNPDRQLHVLSSNGTVAHFESSNANTISQIVFQGLGASAPPNLGATGNDLHFTTNNTERLRITSNGSTYTGGSIITESDMNWGHDTYQRLHLFTGQSGGNPSDAAVVLASPETNPSATRIGSLVFGCKTSSSSGVANSGLKAIIDCSTNTNVSDAWKTGARIDFKTRLDNGYLVLAQSISSDGQVTKPKQYQFLVKSNGTSISQNAWNKLTGLSIDTNHTTGISDGTYWSNSNQRFTAPVTGTYKFFHGGYSTIAATTNNDRYATCFRINGGTLFYIAGGNYCRTDSPMNGHTTVYKLSANDYVELWYYSALAGNWGSGSHGIWWGGYLLG